MPAVPNDFTKRVKAFSKLFALYPASKDVEATMSAYLDVTKDIPFVWLSFAMHELVKRPEKWAPSVGEIRKAAALAARKHYGGGGALQAVCEHEPDTERWLEVAREKEQAKLLGSGKGKP